MAEVTLPPTSTGFRHGDRHRAWPGTATLPPGHINLPVMSPTQRDGDNTQHSCPFVVPWWRSKINSVADLNVYIFFFLIRDKALLCLMQLNVKDCSCSLLWCLFFFLCPPPFLSCSFCLFLSLCLFLHAFHRISFE